MKKPSLNFGEGGFQGFLMRHVEKFVLGVAVMMILLFVYFGFNVESYEKTPDDLKSLAERAQQHIQRDTWENVKEERVPPTGLKTIVEASLRPTDPQPYWTPLPLKPPVKPQFSKRQDPQIYAATDLEVVAMTAAIAMAPGGKREDVLADEPNAEPPKEDEAERRRRERREKLERERANRRNQAGSSGQPPGMGGMEGGGLFGPAGMAGGDDAGDSAMPGYGPEGMPGTGDMFGGGAPGGGGASAIRRFRGKVEGWQPGSGAAASSGMQPGMTGQPGMPGQSGMTGAPSGRTVVPQSHSFVAVKALVPYEKQFEEYERVLEGQFYEAARDMPRYIYIWVERAVVPGDPNAELQWSQLETNRAVRFAEQFGGVVREVAEAKYVDVPEICHPVPPVLMRPLDPLLTHPLLPRAAEAAASSEQPAEGDDSKQPGGDLPGSDLPSGRRPNRMAGGPPGAPGMPGESGMDDGMAPPGMDDGGYGGSSPMGGGPGMPGGMSGGDYEVPKFKLVRFFDYTVEPGKTYKYRVKLFVEDPNNPNPNGRYAAPSRRMLAPEVLARLDDPQRNKKEFWRTTEWSDPSPAVTVPEPDRLLAGSITPGKSTRFDESVVQLEEDSGTLVPVVWDKRRAVDVPAERTVYRGSYLNFQHDAEVVHPVSLIIKLLKAYEFKTNSLVADMRGGEELPGEGEEPLTSPAEFAVIDASGRLIVHNELDDIEAFRRHTLADEEPFDSPGSPFGTPGMGDAGDGGLFGPAGMGPPGMGPPGMSPPGG